MKLVSVTLALVMSASSMAVAAPTFNVNKHTGKVVTAPAQPAKEPSRNTKNDGSKSFVGPNSHEGSKSSNTRK